MGPQAPHPGEALNAPCRFELAGELVSEGERLVVLARLDEGLGRVADEHLGGLGETAGLGERNPRLQKLTFGDGTVDRP